jgi:hypothetical protein
LTLRPNLHRDKEIPVLLQIGRATHPDLADVAFLPDIMKSDEDRAIISVIFDKYQMGRPFFAPPGVPATVRLLTETHADDTPRAAGAEPPPLHRSRAPDG